MKKIFITILFLFMLFSVFACQNVTNNNGEISDEYLKYPSESDMEYIDYGTLNGNASYIKDYNEDMWYYNELKELPLPDPFVYEEDGTFYITGTNDLNGGDTIDIYITTDFKEYFEFEAYDPHASWEKQGKDALIFAPEIFKYEGFYYLTYSNLAKEDNVRYITFLKSTSITGPFEIIQEYNSEGEFIDGDKEPLFTYNKQSKIDVLDQHILDDNGKLYMYYAVFDSYNTEHIVGVEMIDPITANWDSYKVLIIPGKATPVSITNLFYWETYTAYPPVAEAPFVIKSDDGKYYMTYSVNHYPNRYYSVCYAVSDSPLGDYTKPYLQNEMWSNLLLGYAGPIVGDLYDDWGGFMSGCGHHGFFKAGDEWMVVYHAHKNHGTEINDAWMARNVAFDYLYFTEDGKIYTNGPTYSLEPLPSSISGYYNIALGAKVSSVNVKNISNVNDNYIVSNHNLPSRYEGKEVVLGSDFSYILLEFEEEYEIAGISIYNSSKYENMIYEIEYINFFNDNVVFGSLFPECYYSSKKEFVFPNSAFTIEVSDVITNKILICFNLIDEAQINEIKVYGKSVK